MLPDKPPPVAGVGAEPHTGRHLVEVHQLTENWNLSSPAAVGQHPPDQAGDVGVGLPGDGVGLVLQRHARHVRLLPVLGPHVDQGPVPANTRAWNESSRRFHNHGEGPY